MVIDSDVIQHITRCLDLLTNLENIVPSPVGLPNNTQRSAIKRGSVVLGPGFVRHNVLYVPQLTCNLIYVTQLIHAKQCLVAFPNQFCMIQEANSSIPISLGELHDGVYMYKALPIILYVDFGDDSIESWHNRMGHPASQSLSLICVAPKS